MRQKLFICILMSSALLAPIVGSADAATATGGQNVAITKPEPGLYVLNMKLTPLPDTPRPFQAIFIGKITVEAEADASMSFYVDGELQHTDVETPYEWVRDAGLQPPPIPTLQAVVEGADDEIGVVYINPFSG